MNARRLRTRRKISGFSTRFQHKLPPAAQTRGIPEISASYPYNIG